MASSVYFGRGIEIELNGSDNAFPMSPAGKFFADHVAAHIDTDAREGRALDMGTGAGVLSILLKLMGCRDVTAVDLSEPILDAARANAERNVQCRWWCRTSTPGWVPDIRFETSNLFENETVFGRAGGRWDLIVFNAPGWRAPTTDASRHRLIDRLGDAYHARFDGDLVVRRFLADVGRHLTDRGRVLLTMNSLAGINAILESFYTTSDDLQIELIARKEFKIDLSRDMWREHRDIIVPELHSWRRQAGSYFDLSGDDLSFDFEIYDVRRRSPIAMEANRAA